MYSHLDVHVPTFCVYTHMICDNVAFSQFFLHNCVFTCHKNIITYKINNLN